MLLLPLIHLNISTDLYKYNYNEVADFFRDFIKYSRKYKHDLDYSPTILDLQRYFETFCNENLEKLAIEVYFTIIFNKIHPFKFIQCIVYYYKLFLK